MVSPLISVCSSEYDSTYHGRVVHDDAASRGRLNDDPVEGDDVGVAHAAHDLRLAAHGPQHPPRQVLGREELRGKGRSSVISG